MTWQDVAKEFDPGYDSDRCQLQRMAEGILRLREEHVIWEKHGLTQIVKERDAWKSYAMTLRDALRWNMGNIHYPQQAIEALALPLPGDSKNET